MIVSNYKLIVRHGGKETTTDFTFNILDVTRFFKCKSGDRVVLFFSDRQKVMIEANYDEFQIRWNDAIVNQDYVTWVRYFNLN